MTSRPECQPQGARGAKGARLVAVFLAFCLLLPALFVAAEAKHDCPGDGCVVCHVIAGSLQLENMGAPGSGASRQVIPLTLAALVAAVIVRPSRSAQTPVTLKVKITGF